MSANSILSKKALIEVLKNIVDEIDCNKAPSAAPAPTRAGPSCTRQQRGKGVPPLITEPDYRKRGLDDWKYVIPLPEPSRVRSTELIASKMYSGCSCRKLNGLQDNCRRWDCRGAPNCCKAGVCKNSGGRGCGCS